jgi:DNA-directed RNA polymerase specialized sigma24 family protein
MRFWFDMSYRQICEHTRFSEAKVKSSLNCTRKKLAAELDREGITV